MWDCTGISCSSECAYVNDQASVIDWSDLRSYQELQILLDRVSCVCFCIRSCHLYKWHSVWTHFSLALVIFFCDRLSSPSRTGSTNSRRDAEPPFNSSHYLQSRLSLWLFVSLEGGGELKDGCMTGCHSALTPTSVPSLCISVTRVLRHWPAPINQTGRLLASLPRPTLPSLLSPPFLTLLTSSLSSSPLCQHTRV